MYLWKTEKTWKITTKGKIPRNAKIIASLKKDQAINFALYMVGRGYDVNNVEKAYKDWVELKKAIMKQMFGK